VSINRAVLDDPTRHLVAARPPAPRLGRAIASLEDLIDDLSRMTRLAPSQR
jgi:NTE family protein